MLIDGKLLTFPLSLEDLIPLFGEPEKREYTPFGSTKTLYIFHSAGLIFGITDPAFLKSRKIFVDDAHIINDCYLYLSKTVRPMIQGEPVPKHPCSAALTFEGRPITFFSDRAQIDKFNAIYWGSEDENCLDENGNPKGTVSVTFAPKRPKTPANYKIKPSNEETLVFDNFNFKLAFCRCSYMIWSCWNPILIFMILPNNTKGKRLILRVTPPWHRL